jgi:ATP-dependent Clp protease ATP-binding subunit ClpC
MFGKYTGEARRTIFFARYEVSQSGGQAIEPEHLLLGLLRADKSLISRLLGKQGESVREAIRPRIAEHARAGAKLPTAVEVPLSEGAKGVLIGAAEESEGMRHRHVGTEHLLLGVLRLEESFAADVLREQGIEYDGVRGAVMEKWRE